jgi:hypothetical protein
MTRTQFLHLRACALLDQCRADLRAAWGRAVKARRSLWN